MQAQSFYQTLAAAIDDLMEHGFDSQSRLEMWLAKLAQSARDSLVPQHVLVDSVRSMLLRTFKRATNPGRLLRVHRGVSLYTIANIRPALRAELDRRILASANLIKLNRDASIQRTLQRFSGWATSIPIGGTEVGKRAKIKADVRKGIAALPFEERRVIIDQGHKLSASIDHVVALDGGAVAGIWTHVKEHSKAYTPRPEHVARDGKVFIYGGSWAHEQKLIKGPLAEGIEAPAELPFCRCTYVSLYNLRDLPAEMLTAKGKAALADARKKING